MFNAEPGIQDGGASMSSNVRGGTNHINITNFLEYACISCDNMGEPWISLVSVWILHNSGIIVLVLFKGARETGMTSCRIMVSQIEHVMVWNLQTTWKGSGVSFCLLFSYHDDSFFLRRSVI